MDDKRTRICNAWHQAASDLGIRFTAPYSIDLPNGERRTFLGLVHGFGRERGTLIDVLGDGLALTQNKTIGGEYCISQLADTYAEYERAYFIETLDDWGWCGAPDQQPSWYTGKPWS